MISQPLSAATGPSAPASSARGAGRAAQHAALVAVLVLAAGLRLTGLSWGLRQVPDQDEQPFVDNAARIASRGEWDHGFHQYPGLMFYMLAPAVALAGADPVGPPAYLAARGVVVAFSLASCFLVYVLGRRQGGPAAGLMAAGLLAVSPLENFTSHEVKPDIVLGSFSILALLAFARPVRSLWDEALAGASLGAATAVKYTGVLLVAPYLAYRLLEGRWRAGGVALAAAASLATFFALSPATLLLPRVAFAGMLEQFSYHYAAAEQPVAPAGTPYLELARVYAEVLVFRGIGALGAAFVLVGVASAWRQRLPLLAPAVVGVLVFASADMKRERFLIFSLGALCVLGGLGFERLVRGRRPAVAAALFAAALALPLGESARTSAEMRQPTTRDRILDWAHSRLPSGARLLSADPSLNLPSEEFEVLRPTGSPERDATLARHVDAVVALGLSGPLPGGVAPDLVAAPSGPLSGPLLSAFVVPAALRARYAAIPIDTARLSSSRGTTGLDFLRDASSDSEWVLPGPQDRDDWIEVELPGEVTLARVDLLLSRRLARYGRNLELWTAADGEAELSRAPAFSGRAPAEQLSGQGEPPSQVLLLSSPRSVRRLRILQTGRSERRWGMLELRLLARLP